MKKICIVNFNIYCLFNPISNAPMGGAELDMYTLALGLQKHHQVTVVTADWGQKEVEIYNKINVIKSLRLGGSRFWAIFKLLSSLFKANADIYISSGASPEVGLICLFCQMFNKKYIYRTAHDIDCNKTFSNNNGLSGKLYGFGLEHASLIVTSVKNHKDILIQNYPHLKNKIIHINLSIISGLNKIPKKSGVLWVARCTKWKNPELFLKIVLKFPTVTFTMISPKQKNELSFYKHIKNIAANIKNLNFIDFVQYNKTQKYYNKASVFVNTSDAEGFTYSLIQSGLGKTPVVYYKVNPDDVITKYNIGYYSNGKKDLLYKQIQMLLENKKDWHEKSKNINRYVDMHHDIKRIISKWGDAFNNL